MTVNKEVKVPRTNLILNLPGFAIKKVSGFQPLEIEIKYTGVLRCCHCDSKHVRKKDSFVRLVNHELIGHKRTVLKFRAYKLYCNDCKRYGNHRYPGIGKYQRSTNRLQTQVFHQHTQGISQKDLSETFKKGKATIERWYHKHYQLAKKELERESCPTVLGIDEHFFSRKQGFATTLCDLRKNKIFDIVKGRSDEELSNYLQELPGKERVKVVCMDLSPTYRAIIKKYFPNANIVADRFHVIRLLLHHCIMTYKGLSSKIKNNRGILSALRTRPDRLTETKRKRRNEIFKENEAIRVIYQFQQELHALLMNKSVTHSKCKTLIPELLRMIKELKNSPFKHLAKLGRTLHNWREEIARMWRFTKSNGITEGFHRKMKLIQRRAYGFRNFENYRTRVRVLCC